MEVAIANLNGDDECSICLDALLVYAEKGGLLRAPCQHIFHSGCILDWIISGIPGGCCPLCNLRMTTRDVAIVPVVNYYGGIAQGNQYAQVAGPSIITSTYPSNSRIGETLPLTAERRLSEGQASTSVQVQPIQRTGAPGGERTDHNSSLSVSSFQERPVTWRSNTRAHSPTSSQNNTSLINNFTPPNSISAGTVTPRVETTIWQPPPMTASHSSPMSVSNLPQMTTPPHNGFDPLNTPNSVQIAPTRVSEFPGQSQPYPHAQRQNQQHRFSPEFSHAHLQVPLNQQMSNNTNSLSNTLMPQNMTTQRQPPPARRSISPEYSEPQSQYPTQSNPNHFRDQPQDSFRDPPQHQFSNQIQHRCVDPQCQCSQSQEIQNASHGLPQLPLNQEISNDNNSSQRAVRQPIDMQRRSAEISAEMQWHNQRMMALQAEQNNIIAFINSNGSQQSIQNIPNNIIQANGTTNFRPDGFTNNPMPNTGLINRPQSQLP